MSRKTRKRGRQSAKPAAEPTPLVLPVEIGDPYAEFADREWDFYFLPDEEPEPVNEKALHHLMKDWRHGRASRTIGQVLGDAYYMIFSVLVIGAMVGNVLLNSSRTAQGCVSVTCLSGRTLLPWAIVTGSAALVLAAARIFGPVLASAAEGSWLMSAPISRTRLLTGRLWSAVAWAFVGGAAVAAFATLLSGATPVMVTAWTLATGLMAAGAMAWAGGEQTFDRRRGVVIVQTLLGLSAAAIIVLMVAVSAGWVVVPQPPGVDQAPWVLAGVGLVTTVVVGIVAQRRLNELRRARLLSGGSLIAGMQGAAFALDFGLARDILVEREAVERGYVRPTPGRGTGLQALVWRDAQKLRRFPKALLGLVAAALVPYAADALGAGFFMPFLAALALVAAMVPFFGTLRVLSRTGGLARMMPYSTQQIRSAAMIVPGILALIWGIAVFPAVLGLTGGPQLDFTDAVETTVVMAGAGVLGAVRWQTAKRVDYNKPMLATNAGGMQPALIFNLFRGLDVVAAMTAPLILGAPITVSLIIGVILFFLLRIDFDLEEMQEQTKEQRQIVAEERAKQAEKIKIARPQR